VLQLLRIRDFALAGDIEIEFGPGLNVLTGETGAGKSIIVDAVAALLGGRARGGDVKEGEDRALLEAVFVPGPTCSLSWKSWALSRMKGRTR